MKSLFVFFVLSSLVVSAYAGPSIPKCFKEDTSDAAIIRGDNLDPERPRSYWRDRNSPAELSEDYRILFYSQPRLVKSKKLSYVEPYMHCKARWTFALIDYTMQLPNNYICKDTFVYAYRNKLLTMSCPGVSILTGVPIFEAIDSLAPNKRKQRFKNTIEKIFESKRK